MTPNVNDIVYIATYQGVVKATTKRWLSGGIIYKIENGSYLMDHQLDKSWIFKDKKSAAKKAIKLTMVNLKSAERDVKKWKDQIAKIELLAKRILHEGCTI